jgi:hypothetical protein
VHAFFCRSLTEIASVLETPDEGFWAKSTFLVWFHSGFSVDSLTRPIGSHFIAVFFSQYFLIHNHQISKYTRPEEVLEQSNII